MGEASFTYRHDGDPKFVSTNNKMDAEITDFIIENALHDRERHVQNLIDFIQHQAPIDYHSKIIGTSFSATKAAWNQAVEAGLLKPINAWLSFDQRIIEQHYNPKNVFYIQIEDRGLFYLKENPLNLPVPRLEGEVTIEVRMKRGGSSFKPKLGFDTANCVLRASGRLKFKNKSNFSLDDIHSIRSLFGGSPSTCMAANVQRGCAA